MNILNPSLAAALFIIINMFTPLTSFSGEIITHDENSNIDLEGYKARLNELASTDALTLPLSEELELLENLNKFEFGRFLLQNRGLNGYWTSYMISGALKEALTNPLESWIIYSAPSVKATRERFDIFQIQLKKYLKDNLVIASIPCGVMDDLLTIDYLNYKNITLVGVDLDDKSLVFARKKAITHGKEAIVSLANKDAWYLGAEAKYNIILSNGLNIYEPDDQKVIKLYKEFHKALVADGILITSFLSASPAISKESTWKNFNPADLKKQKAIFGDILEVKWQSFRTESQTRKQLTEAGFKVIDIIYDHQGIFPTVVAKKVKK